MKIDPLERRIQNVLELYTLEDLLEMNDIPVAELILRLVEDGTITLPEEEPV